MLQGVISGELTVDGGPRRAIAAGQRQQRLFEHTAFVLVAASEQQVMRLEAIAMLTALGGGVLVKLQRGVSGAGAGAEGFVPVPGGNGVTEQEWWQRQQQLGGRWRRLIVVCGDLPCQAVAELCECWGSHDVVVAMYVLDSITAFKVLGLEGYRPQDT